MAEVPAGVLSGLGAVYRRHRPEGTLLYQIVAKHYPVFAELMSARGRPLPTFVQREFEDYLKCGRLDYGLLRAACPPPFGPAYGCPKSLPAILSARAAAPDASSTPPRCWSTRCCRRYRFASGC